MNILCTQCGYANCEHTVSVFCEHAVACCESFVGVLCSYCRHTVSILRVYCGYTAGTIMAYCQCDVNIL